MNVGTVMQPDKPDDFILFSMIAAVFTALVFALAITINENENLQNQLIDAQDRADIFSIENQSLRDEIYIHGTLADQKCGK